jgi:hypothetical protein
VATSVRPVQGGCLARTLPHGPNSLSEPCHASIEAALQNLTSLDGQLCFSHTPMFHVFHVDVHNRHSWCYHFGGGCYHFSAPFMVLPFQRGVLPFSMTMFTSSTSRLERLDGWTRKAI